MELLSPTRTPNGGSSKNSGEICSFSDEIDSNCSTPYVSAPSSPGRHPGGYFFSAPASPVHYVLSSSAVFSAVKTVGSSSELAGSGGSFEFDGANPSESMISADELFLNGKIRPVKLSSHLKRPQNLAPLVDLNEEDEEDEAESNNRGRDLRLRSRSIHRRTRSMSPMRNSPPIQWQGEEEIVEVIKKADLDPDPKESEAVTNPSDSSASSSRSSSSGRNSKRWIFLKDLLYRSKSEGQGRGRSNGKEKDIKFWHSISFSPASKDPKHKDPKQTTKEPESKDPKPKRPTNGVRKRKGAVPSAHERHYTANRAQAEEMRRRTFLPYRQGLLGCLGFSSRSFGAMNGFAKTLNPVSSR